MHRSIEEIMSSPTCIAMQYDKIPVLGDMTSDGLIWRNSAYVEIGKTYSLSDPACLEPAMNNLTGRFSIASEKGYTHYCVVEKTNRKITVLYAGGNDV